MLAKYENIDLTNVSVKVDRSGDYDVLELNIVLPDDATTAASAPPDSGSKKSAALSA